MRNCDDQISFSCQAEVIDEALNKEIQKQNNHITGEALGVWGRRLVVDRTRALGDAHGTATSAVYLHPTESHHAN